ncbi:hypothetical protein JRO89_XS10G0208500 [Xanthoceras sorbifolium]|uniref:Protein kinase domain-containing protein n=1 Tax=Xanthoceras sorbifolium TaxID=99658 RepID=A0ABQ8HJP5_9ROSI|nr:hypothetical protein JRO89_XS10G0208500 [Xanthoceras sorbifolium]
MEFYMVVVLCLMTVANSATDPNDWKILYDFKNGLDNPELLKWPLHGDDPCGPPSWPHVFCSGNRVTQIQIKDLGVKGPLPQNFNQLTKLYNLGLQRNNFYGKLPSFSGLSELEYVYLDYNGFDTIPSDFFDGLTSLRVLALDSNPFNQSTGWSIPDSLAKSVQLTNLSLMHCNLLGPLPDFLGKLPSLTALKLSYNRLSGEIPASFGQSLLQILWLNDQDGEGMTGPIDVVAKMVSLSQLWLHGNDFTGTIPEDIGALSSLRELNLNGNQLVGLIPQSLASMQLDKLDLNNNLLMGPIPEFKSGNVSYESNSFCLSKPGVACASDVNILLDFLGGLGYPFKLASHWSGNDPCKASWLGLSCDSNSKVSIINLPRFNLSGTLTPSIANLDSLIEIRLGGNSINGAIPKNFTELKSLRLLDVTNNNIGPPLPEFRDGVRLVIDGNPLLDGVHNRSSPSPSPSPPMISQPPPRNSSSGSRRPSPPRTGSVEVRSQPKSSRTLKLLIIVGIAVAAVLVLILVLLFIYCCKKRKGTLEAPSSIVVHPRDPSDPENIVKIAVLSNTTGSLSTKTAASSGSYNSGATESSNVVESGNLVISVQVLRKVTGNFAPQNELGRGGFGTVYKGELEDGTKIAVKRMETGVSASKGLDEFQAEIGVLSKVRHRHLVSLLAYSIEGTERLLVYEYLPQGALSKHLFHWKSQELEPLTWTQRLIIALDVARGMEYLHSLALQTFIHRDLKSSNILLDDDFRAKVSDFGLVKLAPDGKKSVATRLAGTFGYLAPEYAVMGKITTKADVFSYGVVLMELLTGLTALGEERSEETRYLAEWFCRIKSSKERLMAALDPTLEANEETFKSISIIAELAGHCTAREPYHRPDMCHVVNVLAQIVEKWIPINDESVSSSGIDLNVPLAQMLKNWQNAESRKTGHSCLEDSKGSIPARPAGFAESFNSSDGR